MLRLRKGSAGTDPFQHVAKFRVGTEDAAAWGNSCGCCSSPADSCPAAAASRKIAQREKCTARANEHSSAVPAFKVTKVEVKQVDIPENMQRAIAKQAEAERERRAKIIHAEGEFEASQKLADAAEVLEKQPAAIQLRYLQTLTEIGVEKNTTIVFPLPVDIISQWVKAFAEKK